MIQPSRPTLPASAPRARACAWAARLLLVLALVVAGLPRDGAAGVLAAPDHATALEQGAKMLPGGQRPVLRALPAENGAPEAYLPPPSAGGPPPPMPATAPPESHRPEPRDTALPPPARGPPAV
jgi:hypothetical protein